MIGFDLERISLNFDKLFVEVVTVAVLSLLKELLDRTSGKTDTRSGRYSTRYKRGEDPAVSSAAHVNTPPCRPPVRKFYFCSTVQQCPVQTTRFRVL